MKYSLSHVQKLKFLLPLLAMTALMPDADAMQREGDGDAPKKPTFSFSSAASSSTETPEAQQRRLRAEENRREDAKLAQLMERDRAERRARQEVWETQANQQWRDRLRQEAQEREAAEAEKVRQRKLKEQQDALKGLVRDAQGSVHYIPHYLGAVRTARNEVIVAEKAVAALEIDAAQPAGSAVQASGSVARPVFGRAPVDPKVAAYTVLEEKKTALAGEVKKFINRFRDLPAPDLEREFGRLALSPSPQGEALVAERAGLYALVSEKLEAKRAKALAFYERLIAERAAFIVEHSQRKLTTKYAKEACVDRQAAIEAAEAAFANPIIDTRQYADNALLQMLKKEIAILEAREALLALEASMYEQQTAALQQKQSEYRRTTFFNALARVYPEVRAERADILLELDTLFAEAAERTGMVHAEKKAAYEAARQARVALVKSKDLVGTISMNPSDHVRHHRRQTFQKGPQAWIALVTSSLQRPEYRPAHDVLKMLYKELHGRDYVAPAGSGSR